MTDHTEPMARYRRFREVGRKLNTELVHRLPRGVLQDYAKRLGLLHGKTLVFSKEEESIILFDHCIYTHRHGGRTVVESFLDKPPRPLHPEEIALLQAEAKARFSLYIVEHVTRGVGVTLRDIFRHDSLFLVDQGFSQTVPKGMGLATRVIAPEGICMTTGAALPFSKEIVADAGINLQEKLGMTDLRDIAHLSTEQLVEFEAIILRSCLAHDASSYVGYKGVDEPVRASSVPRNAPCPCGSGKKYKKCCG